MLGGTVLPDLVPLLKKVFPRDVRSALDPPSAVSTSASPFMREFQNPASRLVRWVDVTGSIGSADLD